MSTNTAAPKAISGNFFVRRMRETAYLITTVPILIPLFALVSWALSSGTFIPLALLIILVLLTFMEHISRFEIKRANWILGTRFQSNVEPWFKNDFFSWEGAKERAISLRSWSAIGYVFIAFGLSILSLIVAISGMVSVALICVRAGLFTVHPWSGNFEIRDWSLGFAHSTNDSLVNAGLKIDGQNVSLNLVDMSTGQNPVPENFTWTYMSTATLISAIAVLLLSILSVPAISKWMRELILRFLSTRSFAEIYYGSDSRRKKAITVGSQDRSRIERDLHDGVQARLVISGMEIDRARLIAEKSEDKEIAHALERAAEETANAMQEIRNLVRGLRPALLEKGGLQAALESLGEKQEFSVKVSAKIERLDPEMESAIYLICSEAMTNIGRHSEATTMSLTVNKKGRLVTVDIEDNGVGGADETRGTGIRNMRDRVDALGGEFILMSPTGGPTIIKVVLPCE
jgi:signal transduction histidine kinase